MRLTVFWFAVSTSSSLPSWRFCFGDWLRRFPDIWPRLTSLPVPVTLKFFFALECDFCFGIFLHSCVLRRAEHHRHVPPFEERLGLDESNLLHVVRETHEQVASAIRMLALAAPEHDRDLDLRALVEEALDVALLGLVVVDPDLGSELDLLDVDLRLVLAGELRLLLQLVPVLAEIHDAGNRRIGLGRDFDEIEVLPVRVLARLVRRLDSELLPALTDQAHPRDADGIVDAGLRLRPARLLEPPGTATWPQMSFTKLVLTSSWNRKTAGMQRRGISSTLLG